MPKAKDKVCIAYVYGTKEDGRVIKAIAQANGQSVSEYVLEKARAAYKRQFGDIPPDQLFPT